MTPNKHQTVGGRNKTAPDRFRPGEKNKPNHRRYQPEKLILSSVIGKPLDIKRLNQAMTKSQQALKNPRFSGQVSLATDAGLDQIEGSATWNSDIKELVEFSLTYEVLRGLTSGKLPILHLVLGSNVTNGYISALVTSSRGLREDEQKKPRHIKVEKKSVKKKDAPNKLLLTLILPIAQNIASPLGRCVCGLQKNESRRKGGLCGTRQQ